MHSHFSHGCNHVCTNTSGSSACAPLAQHRATASAWRVQSDLGLSSLAQSGGAFAPVEQVLRVERGRVGRGRVVWGWPTDGAGSGRVVVCAQPAARYTNQCNPIRTPPPTCVLDTPVMESRAIPDSGEIAIWNLSCKVIVAGAKAITCR